MKRWIAILLGVICVFSLIGCGASRVDDWPKPPDLTVVFRETIIEAPQFSYDWTSDGRSVNACGSVFWAKEDAPSSLPSLTLDTSADSAVLLHFAVAPDSVRVLCWSDGEQDPENSEEIAADALESGENGAEYRVNLKDGDFVYEVYAEWSRSEKRSGNAYYGFCTEAPE